MAADDLTTFAMCETVFKPAVEDQAMVKKLISAASVWANTVTSRFLAARALTEVYDGRDSTVLFARNYPINGVTSIHQDEDRAFPAGTLVAAADYIFSTTGPRTITAVNDVIWESGIQTIQVIYNAGYATVPGDLENAILILVDYWYKSYSAHRFGVTSVGVDDQRIAYERGIPKQVLDMVAPYAKAGVM